MHKCMDFSQTRAKNCSSWAVPLQWRQMHISSYWNPCDNAQLYSVKKNIYIYKNFFFLNYLYF